MSDGTHALVRVCKDCGEEFERWSKAKKPNGGSSLCRCRSCYNAYCRSRPSQMAKVWVPAPPKARRCSVCSVEVPGRAGRWVYCDGCRAKTMRENSRANRKRQAEVKRLRRTGGLNPYNDPDHRALSKLIKVAVFACHFGCGRVANSVDHVPPLVEHEHVRGSGCCEVRPACRRCNCQQGATLANARR